MARESTKTTPELPGPLSGPWTPAESESGSALVMCMQAHNLLRPPPQMKILDPPLIIQCVPQKRKPINQVNFSENLNDLSEKVYIVTKFSLSSFF